MIHFFREGIADMKEGFALRHIWWNLALFEVRSRYKRTKLGPLWITLSTLIMLIAMGPLYARLFNKNMGEYYLYIACGFVFWNYLVSTIQESAKGLVEAQTMILSYGFPISMYLYKILCRNIIILVHNMVIILLAIILFSPHFGIFSLGFIVSYLLILANLFFIGIFVSLISARFRDIEQIITSMLTVMFFLTPILWDPKALGDRYYLLYFNPFFSFIDALRTPLIGNTIPYYSLTCMVIILLVCAPLSVMLLGRVKHRVALWL